MIAYKLVRKRQNGTYGPLFINRKQVLRQGGTYQAEGHPTQGYARRPGWHCTKKPVAPHLSMRGRVWVIVEVLKNLRYHPRPIHQGGEWVLSDDLKILGEMK